MPKIGALLSDGAAYRYLPKSVAYLPPPAEMVAMLRRAGFADAQHRLLVGRARRSSCSAPGRLSVRAVTTALDVELDLNDVARGDGYLFVRDGVGFAGRGVAARVPIDEAVEFLAAIEHDDQVGGTARPDRARRCPVPARLAGRAGRPRRAGRQGRADGRTWVTTHRRCRRADLAARSSRQRRRRRAYTMRPLVPIEHYLTAVAARRDAVRAGRIDEGGDRPPDRRRVRPPDRRARRAASASRRRSGRATGSRSTA